MIFMKWNNQMRRTNGFIRKVFAIILLSGCLIDSLTGAELTNEYKINVIDEIIAKKIKEAKGGSVDLSEIMDAVGQKFPLDAETASGSTDVIENLKQQVKKKYPASDAELEAKYRTEAESLYPAYKQGDEVTVTYHVYNKQYQVSGLFYKSDSENIWVGGRKISRKTISSEDAPRFDVKSAESKRQQYIREKIAEYHRGRNEYERQLMKNQNEDIEFSRNKLKIGKKWLPVKSAVEQRYEEAVASQNREIARSVQLAKKHQSISNFEYLISQYPNHPDKSHWENMLIFYKIEKAKDSRTYKGTYDILESLVNQYPDHPDKIQWMDLLNQYKQQYSQRTAELQRILEYCSQPEIDPLQLKDQYGIDLWNINLLFQIKKKFYDIPNLEKVLILVNNYQQIIARRIIDDGLRRANAAKTYQEAFEILRGVIRSCPRHTPELAKVRDQLQKLETQFVDQMIAKAKEADNYNQAFQFLNTARQQCPDAPNINTAIALYNQYQAELANKRRQEAARSARSSQSSRRRICADCSGSGKVSVFYNGRWWDRSCPNCNGTGDPGDFGEYIENGRRHRSIMEQNLGRMLGTF